MSQRDEQLEVRAQRRRPVEPEPVPAEVQERDRRHNELLRRSLGPGRPTKKATDLSGSVLLGAAIVGAFLAGELWWAWVGVGMAACLGLGLMEWSRVWYPKEQRRWLERLPFEFDTTRYLASLSTGGERRHLELEVTFRQDVVRASASSPVEDLARALPETTVQVVRNDTLHIIGPTLTTHYIPERKAAGLPADPVFDNSSLHAFFRRCMLRGLKPMVRQWPIRRVVARAVTE